MRLLMLEHDPQLIAAIRRGLEAYRIEVLAARSVSEARTRASEEVFAAALLDCDLLGDDELDAFAGLPLILATARLEPVGGHRFFGRGVLLGKPFTSTQLLSALNQACAHVPGRRDNLLDVLRRAHSARESFVLRVEDALLIIERGEIVHAERAKQRGEQALVQVLSLPQPSFTRQPTRPYLRTIERPFHALMLELLQRIEDREQREPQS